MGPNNNSKKWNHIKDSIIDFGTRISSIYVHFRLRTPLPKTRCFGPPNIRPGFKYLRKECGCVERKRQLRIPSFRCIEEGKSKEKREKKGEA